MNENEKYRKALRQIADARIKFEGQIPSPSNHRAWEIATHVLVGKVREIAEKALT